jgi:DNA-binding CsgD family transcriptional regulator
MAAISMHPPQRPGEARPIARFEEGLVHLRNLRSQSERLILDSLESRLNLSLTIASFVEAAPNNESLRGACRRTAELGYHSVLKSLANRRIAGQVSAKLQPRLERLRLSLAVLELGTEEACHNGSAIEPARKPPVPAVEPRPARVLDELTNREVEVLRSIAIGHSTKEIAYRLGISFKTAACHRYRVMEKLDIHDTANLVRYAIREGLIQA